MEILNPGNPKKHQIQLLKVRHVPLVSKLGQNNSHQVEKILCTFNHSIFLGAPICESTIVYDQIHEYEDLEQNKEEKSYVNNEVVDKIYVSLKPVVMEKIRDHMQSTVSLWHTCSNATKMSKL